MNKKRYWTKITIWLSWIAVGIPLEIITVITNIPIHGFWLFSFALIGLIVALTEKNNAEV